MKKHDDPLDEILSEEGPEFEVWNHLYSGLDLAKREFDGLSEKGRAMLITLGERVFSQRTDLAVASDDRFAGLSRKLLEFPWVKFAADIAFAEQAVYRATKALDRYVELQPILTRYRLSELASKYVQEAGRTFLFSFDAACVAFCSAALEQVLRDALIDANVTTRRDLKRDRLTAASLLAKARREKLLGQAAEDAASDLIAKRNAVMHGTLEGIKDDALKAIDHLGIVLQELGRVRATDA